MTHMTTEGSEFLLKIKLVVKGERFKHLTLDGAYYLLDNRLYDGDNWIAIITAEEAFGHFEIYV